MQVVMKYQLICLINDDGGISKSPKDSTQSNLYESIVAEKKMSHSADHTVPPSQNNVALACGVVVFVVRPIGRRLSHHFLATATWGGRAPLPSKHHSESCRTANKGSKIKY